MAKQEKQQVELVRIMDTDIRAGSSLLYGLAKVRGINVMFANAVCRALGLDRNREISTLTEEEVEKIESFLSNPVKEGIPEWMLNQRKEFESGENHHYVSKDIEFNHLQYTRRFNKLKTYRSIRRRANLTLRGQRTKSNFRRNKTIAAMKAKKLEGRK